MRAFAVWNERKLRVASIINFHRLFEWHLWMWLYNKFSENSLKTFNVLLLWQWMNEACDVIRNFPVWTTQHFICYYVNLLLNFWKTSQWLYEWNKYIISSCVSTKVSIQNCKGTEKWIQIIKYSFHVNFFLFLSLSHLLEKKI